MQIRFNGKIKPEDATIIAGCRGIGLKSKKIIG
jgi:hypothetical protein